ncbi:tyrosine-type recombinase/integrase [Bradyrhizobium sp. Pha-3]|uniref:tyrosine-type recombinase/integrase n=1 Tax=Bradyrhizobium sp. Pha-3 TaxID=208375 RepID=UPI0035D5122D
MLFAGLDGALPSQKRYSKGLERLPAQHGFHNLRHPLASQLFDAGVDIVTISKRLGPAKPDITLRVYAHLFRNDDGKAAAAINAALARQVPNRVPISRFVLFESAAKHLKLLVWKGGRVV